MRVTLIDFTGAPDPWRAADLLIFTKNTRLKMTSEGLLEIMGWPIQRKKDELAYVANTIRSSWEMVDYVFALEGVTRAFTHQLVRTRHGSYAQQTQQVLRLELVDVQEPDFEPGEDKALLWDNAVDIAGRTYDQLIKHGATVEEARGILPTNTKTNIVAKFNLRTLSEVFAQRISPRNLGEYSEVARAMRAEVIRAHPWAEVFLNQSRHRYLEKLDEMIQRMWVIPDGERSEHRVNMLKLVDQIRRDQGVADE